MPEKQTPEKVDKPMKEDPRIKEINEEHDKEMAPTPTPTPPPKP